MLRKNQTFLVIFSKMLDRKKHFFFLFRSNDKGEFVGNQQHIFEWKLQCLHQTYFSNHNKEGQKFHNLSFYLPKKWEKPHFLSTKISFLSEHKHSVTAFCLSATYFYIRLNNCLVVFIRKFSLINPRSIVHYFKIYYHSFFQMFVWIVSETLIF